MSRPLELATIVRLFLDGCPTAIPGLVILIVVDAVKLMVAGWFPAEFIEEDGVVVPNNRELNSTSAVAFPIFILGIAAAVAGGGPRLPFYGFPIAMLGIFTTYGGVFGASAGFDTLRFQIWSSDNMVATTITATKPTRIFNVGFDGQNAEALTNKIDYALFAKLFTSLFANTSARFGCAGFERVIRDDFFVSAFAEAIPVGISFTERETKNSQPPEYLVGKVDHTASIPHGGWYVERL